MTPSPSISPTSSRGASETARCPASRAAFSTVGSSSLFGTTTAETPLPLRSARRTCRSSGLPRPDGALGRPAGQNVCRAPAFGTALKFPPAANRARQAVSAHAGDDRWRFRSNGPRRPRLCAVCPLEEDGVGDASERTTRRGGRTGCLQPGCARVPVPPCERLQLQPVALRAPGAGARPCGSRVPTGRVRPVEDPTTRWSRQHPPRRSQVAPAQPSLARAWSASQP